MKRLNGYEEDLEQEVKCLQQQIHDLEILNKTCVDTLTADRDRYKEQVAKLERQLKKAIEHWVYCTLIEDVELGNKQEREDRTARWYQFVEESEGK